MFRKAAILNSLPITISKEEPALSEFEFITFCTRAHLILRDYVDYMSTLYSIGIDVSSLPMVGVSSSLKIKTATWGASSPRSTTKKSWTHA